MSVEFAQPLVPRCRTKPRSAQRWIDAPAANRIANAASGRAGAPAMRGLVVPGLLSHIGRLLWRTLEAAGQARAAVALNRLAVQYAFEPELAQALRAASRVEFGH